MKDIRDIEEVSLTGGETLGQTWGQRKTIGKNRQNWNKICE